MSDDRISSWKSPFISLVAALFAAAALAACSSDGGPNSAGDGGVDGAAPADASGSSDGSGPQDAGGGVEGSVASAPFYPFGSRLDGPYPHGIKVSGHSNAQMDAMVEKSYEAWKGVRLKAAPPFTADSGIYAGKTISDGYFVQFGDTNYSTVSEGMGYGMLITVVMAGYDAKAQSYFDGLFKVARGRPAYGMPSTAGANVYLSDWRLNPDMSSGGGGYNASDGDLDIALALLMADRQWGSGAINYKKEALSTIGALKAVNFAPNGVMYAPQNLSRTSDYMIGHFRTFRAVTGDAFWDDARVNSLKLIQYMVKNFSPTARLQPGFIDHPLTSMPYPSPGNRIEGPQEGMFDSNAVRNPWRWGVDFIYSNDPAWHDVVNEMVTFLKNDAGGDPNNTSYAYSLDGVPQSNRYFSEQTCGPLMVGSMVDSAHQKFLDTLFDKNVSAFSTGYYSSELQLLPLIVASGNWWRP